MTTKHENVKAKWANVEAQLQRRADLLNNLIETAKLAGVQEQEVFGKIAEARSKLLNATQQTPQGAGGDKTPEQKQAVIDAESYRRLHPRSEEHTSELQSRLHLVCRLLLEKKKKKKYRTRL